MTPSPLDCDVIYRRPLQPSPFWFKKSDLNVWSRSIIQRKEEDEKKIINDDDCRWVNVALNNLFLWLLPPFFSCHAFAGTKDDDDDAIKNKMK